VGRGCITRDLNVNGALQLHSQAGNVTGGGWRIFTDAPLIAVIKLAVALLYCSLFLCDAAWKTRGRGNVYCLVSL
jgi:hypothetical protein